LPNLKLRKMFVVWLMVWVRQVEKHTNTKGLAVGANKCARYGAEHSYAGLHALAPQRV
jgi:hypothetical protein